MTLKIIGAILIIAGCAGVGLSAAANHRREERAVRSLIGALDYMGCELQYHLPPLPLLCRAAAAEAGGVVGQAFFHLAAELDSKTAPDASACMETAIGKTAGLPPSVRKNLSRLGTSLGHFDLQGQLNGLEGVRNACHGDLEGLLKDREQRLRNYQTLGICAGSALAILFL